MMNIEEELLKYVKQINDSGREVFTGFNYGKILENKLNEIEKSIYRNEKNVANNYENKIKEMSLEIRIQEEREKKLLNSAKVFIKDENQGMIKSIEASIKIINRELENMKVKRTGEKGEFFNENYHECIGYRRETEMCNNEILRVIKHGYLYKDKVFRYAKVIIVNNNLEENNEFNRY